MHSPLARISLLPEHLIDQIKAGEVIERPGNLLKEILENSLDANPTRLELTLKNNGLDLINLKDDGHGMLSQDLPLAFSRHATSKISMFEDLYRLSSFGFRGEALASISAISKLQCITYNEVEAEGSEIRIEGGLTTYAGRRQKTHQRGTELNIQDLFFNTPARLKFIQSQQAEKNFIKKVIFSFIIAHPQVEFVLKFDEDEKEIYPARAHLKERLFDLIPKCKDQSFHTQKSYEENNLELHMIPGNLRSPVKLQYIYINNRYVLDKQIHRVLTNAMAAHFGTDDFHFILFMNMPADHIDVNVHPNKTIIKLFETSKVMSLITGSVKELAHTTRSQRPVEAQAPVDKQGLLVDGEAPSHTLSQERHSYNMEGHFSPHALVMNHPESFIWMGHYFLYPMHGGWEAVSAPRILSGYVKKKLSPTLMTIPLLVSEPFKNKNVSLPRIQELHECGIELEKLSADTLVLRCIPEWMNGFPLKDIVSALIDNRDLKEIEIHSKDWSQSIWEGMIQEVGLPELRSQKISMDLKQLLEDKLK